MDYINYCIKLRREGHDTGYILNQLREKGIPEDKAIQYFRNSESLFLDQQTKKKAKGHTKKLHKIFHYFSLLLILLLMIASFIGYIDLGIIPLAIILIALQSGKTIWNHKQKFQR